ncbi:MAG: PAS domain S-box protein [Planctomycetia bacterium]|nr:PAS domain S-box protein [Planctomycetia bacterium]
MSDPRHAPADDAVQAGERRIRAILETAHDAFVAIDAAGRIVEWNRRAQRTFGWTREEALGRTLAPLLIPERYRAAHEAGLTRFLATGKAQVFGRVLQLAALTQSGEEIPVELTIAPVEVGMDGGDCLFAAFIRDVRQARSVEQKLRDSEALYASTLENLPLCVLRKDLDGRFTFANQAFCRLLGRDLPQIVGKTDFDFFPPALAQKYRSDDERILTTGEMFEDVERHQTVEGKTLYVQVKKTALHDSTGRTVGVQVTFWDVTQQKEAEDALRQSEKRFQQLADNIVEVFWITTADGADMVYVSPAYEQIWGRTCRSLYENPHQWLECIHAKDRGRVAKAFIEKGPLGQFDETYRIIRPDGKVRWIRDRGFPVRDASGRVYRIAGTAQDVTRQKRAEIALRRAKRQAESANRAKDTFLANVSHEIRTPMNAVIGLTELVLATPVSTQQRQHLQTVVSSAESLLAIINDILDFSKIEAGKLELDEVRFDLGEMLGDTLKSIAVKAHEKGLELTYGVRPDVPAFLVGDPVRLRQIVLNLVGNAIKFTNRGEIVLAVQCRERTDGQTALQFSVTDTGIGIPADKQEAVFRPFVQGDMSTTREFGGTGLGLSISSRLVERMGGKMWVESEPGKGSTFHFTARFDIVPGEAPTRLIAGRTTLRGLRVLVVDDNAANRSVLEEMLRQWDMRPALASNAEEAIEMLRSANGSREPLALVLTDAQMPGRDGFGFVEQAIAANLLGGAVVMMLTSGDRFGDLARCRELGIAAHLFKPIKPSELLDVIVDLFGMKLPSAEEMQAVAPAAARPLRVLLAEDSPVNQKLAVGLLELHGHKVTVVTNGREAVAALDVLAGAECPFDLVLMDLQMPEMDGLQATAAIRTREKGTGRRVPIVALTAHAMKSDRDRCLAAGMDAYVSKPIRTRELFAAVAELLPAGEAAEARAPSADIPRAASAASDEALPPAMPGPVDWAAALAAAGGDRGLLTQVLAAFLEESPRRLADMRRAIDAKDFPLLRRSAHTLKSSLRILGVREAFELALSLEQHGAEGRLDEAEGLLADLSQRLETIQAQVSAYLGAAAK